MKNARKTKPVEPFDFFRLSLGIRRASRAEFRRQAAAYMAGLRAMGLSPSPPRPETKRGEG